MLNTDLIQPYKPDPGAYQMVIDAFRLPKQEILFAAFARLGCRPGKKLRLRDLLDEPIASSVEELGVEPDAIGGGAGELVKLGIRT